MTTMTRVRGQDMFDLLRGESEQPRSRKPEIKIDLGLEKFILTFLDLSKALRDQDIGYYRDCYRACLTRVPAGAIKARDVESFSLWLNDEVIKSQDDGLGPRNAGMYITMLASYCPEKEVTVHTRHLETRLDYLGCLLTDKHLIVKGDAGDCLGIGMLRNGLITVRGNARGWSGKCLDGGKIIVEGDNDNSVLGLFMTSGEIEVYGNVNGGAGNFMEGGRIKISGNVDGVIGNVMEGGEIIIEGDVNRPIGPGMKNGTIRVYGKRPRVSEAIEGGVIYHRDRVIYDGRKSR